jgi:hypothetical protein
MRAARECLLKAEQCETMARDSSDAIDQGMLRETAKHWRTLAAVAEPGRGRRETIEKTPERDLAGLGSRA